MVEAGDLREAIALLAPLRAKNDAPDLALGLLGGLHVEVGSFDEALEVLLPLAERDDADAGVLYNAGRAAEGLGLLAEAARWYGKSLEREPVSPALRALGMMLGRNGRPGDAYVSLQPWTAANPDDHEARKAAAAAAIALQRTPEAEVLLEPLSPDAPDVKLLRAQVHLQRADPWSAINELRPLAAEPPSVLEGAVRRSLAKAYLVVGEAEGAVEQMELLEGLEDVGAEDAVILASARFQAGRLQEALDTLAPFAEPLTTSPRPSRTPPATRDIALDYGRYLHAAGESDRALPLLRLAAELGGDSPEVFQALGQALAASGDRDEAKKALDRFRELSRTADDDVASTNRRRRDIDDPTGRELRAAMELAAAGELDQALERLDRESRLAPSDPRPAYAASSLLLDAGRNEEALAAADRALAAAPERADGLYQRGAVLMSLARLAEAERMFRQALQTQPTHAATLSDYAVLLMSGGRSNEAAGLLHRLLELRPGDLVAHGHLDRLRSTGASSAARNKELPPAALGRELLRNRDFRAAEAPLDRAVLLNPQDASLRIDLASALWENNKPAMAESHAREATALDPSSAAAHRMLGGLLLWHGEHLEAAQSLERATALGETDGALLLDLARSWDGAAGDAAGKADERSLLAKAEEAYGRAVAAMPDHSEALYGLAKVIQLLGREDEAAAHLERYVKLYGDDQQATRNSGLAAAKSPPDGN